jgi:hypothetical protein
LKIRPDLRSQVAERADLGCEYWLIHEEEAAFAREGDHIVSRQHGGETVADNLCMLCNRYKDTNISSMLSDAITRLFNPRLERWSDHFALNSAVIQPLTPMGEATAKLLRLNTAERVIERNALQGLGRYPRA